MIGTALVGLTLAVGIGACGAGSTHTGSSARHAVIAHATTVRRVPSPKGAVRPSRATFARLVRVSVGVSAHIRGIDNTPITQAIPALSGDLNQFWSQEFASSGVQWPNVQDVLVQGSAVQTQCSSHPTVAPADPWFACLGQGVDTFYWTVAWMQQNVDTDPGGVNLALGMAGLYGEAVQGAFGFLQSYQQGQLPLADFQQQNLCLVGIYARSLNQRQLFEQADVATIKTWLNALGGGSTSGAASGQQLQQAFVAGFDSGAPSSCGVHAGSGGSGGAGATGTSTGASTSGARTGAGTTT